MNAERAGEEESSKQSFNYPGKPMDSFLSIRNNLRSGQSYSSAQLGDLMNKGKVDSQSIESHQQPLSDLFNAGRENKSLTFNNSLTDKHTTK